MASEVLSVSNTSGDTKSESGSLNGESGKTNDILGITMCKAAGARE